MSLGAERPQQGGVGVNPTGDLPFIHFVSLFYFPCGWLIVYFLFVCLYLVIISTVTLFRCVDRWQGFELVQAKGSSRAWVLATPGVGYLSGA